MLATGFAGFVETRVAVPIDLRAARAAPPAALESVVADATIAVHGDARLLADGAWLRIRDRLRNPTAAGIVVMDLAVAATIDPAIEGRLVARGAMSRGFDLDFLGGGDSTESTRAGIGAALRGSLMVLAVTLALALPVGILAALYLEEFAPRSRLAGLIEVSINNLAAVPSIIFGLLGLLLFLGTLGLPRSAPLVGGLTLGLMTMPVIVISGRGAIRAVPGSVREAALAIGASRVQVTFHHVLPLAWPGILTGAIIGAARALGETAPLLLIGMRAFIPTAPAGIGEPATVLPVQIFLWSDQIDRGFVEKTSAAIVALLALLFAMNGLAAWLRHRAEAGR